ncbi:DUF4868 domain-containing protein [Enterococcus avium]|uniref:Kiwa anti-phage protein KwaB-like domain-containing protein n=1 Tax=Enterococcus avium TaxID=33945 RepID=UPI00288C7283|nr:Kiwa anti-phage protein KwaB-like domain-containing protein [Enterococcus avium]MDT2490728.1 DUF4868 domain-containing protein [Enterococcus avium]
MNIQDIRNFINDVNEDLNDSICMKIVRKIGDGIEIGTPDLPLRMRHELKRFYIEILNNNFFDLEQRNYDPSIVVEGTLQVADLLTAHIEDILDDLSNPDNINGDINEIEIEKINYYVFEFQRNNERLLLFRRFTKMNKIRNGILGIFDDNSFRSIDTRDFFGLDRDVDIIIFREEALIVNRFALQTIFKLNDYFAERAEEALTSIRQHNIIANFDQFYQDCLTDKLSARRMTKIINTPGRLEGFFEHIENLPLVINHFQLDIGLENGQIIYNETKESRNHILGCISDGYYQSLIQERYGEEIN